MKTVYLFLFALCIPVVLTAQSTMKVTITNIRETEGTLMVALHSGEDTFPNEEPDRALTAPADKERVTITFDDLPKGNYALSIYHDLNENGELDKNIMGIPKEGFGFSNDAMGTFGAPSFKECIIQVDGNSTVETTVTLKHM